MGIGSQLDTAARAAGSAGNAVPASRLKALAAAAAKRIGPMSPDEVAAAMRALQRGEQLDQTTVLRLQRTPGVAAAPPTPAAPAVEAVADASAARPFSQVGKQLVSEADPSVVVRRLDDERFVYPDGTVVDVNGNVLGKTAVDDLTEVSGDTKLDNLDASATDLGDEGAPRKSGKDNLTPNSKKVDSTKELADAIWQSTTPTDLESMSQQSLKRLLREAQKHRTADGYSPDFLAKFPNAEAGAERLARLEELAGVSNADRAAEQIDTAAQARGVANTPRPPTGNRTATSDDFKAAKELVGETIPAGDWNALTEAFNKLDDDQRKSVLSALPSDTRQFLSQMLDPNQPSPSFLPNLVAARTRPVDVSGVTAAPSPSAPRPDTSAAASLIDLAASRVAHQKRMTMLDYSDQIEAARGDKARVDALIEERNAAIERLDSILQDRDSLAGIARRQAEDDALSQMVALDEAAKAADNAGDSAKARELRRRIAVSEGKLAELRNSLDLHLSAVDDVAPQSDEARLVARAANDQQQAATALRNALLGQDEMYRAEKARMQRAAVPQPQPAAVTPGARSPEFAAEDVPDAEMPTAFDVATAARKEAQAAVDARAAGGGLPEQARMEAMGLDDTDTQRDLPLFLRGRDRNPPLESRPRGERSVESNDLRAINKAQELEDEVNAALAEAKSATGAADLARAKKRVLAAYAAMDKAYPPRLVNPKTGEAKDLPAGMDAPPKGWVIERGRKAMSDSRLNKGGQQQTYDEAILAMTGFRPRPQQSINRATTGLSSEDVAGLNTEAKRVFGDDADELLDGDFDPDWDASHSGLDLEANGSKKKGRLGGQQQASRVEGAAQLMFGDTNPFGMTNADGTPLFATADAVAEEILSRGTLFKPGTANYELAKSRIAQVIDRKFAGAAKTDPKTVTAAKKQAKNTAEFIPDPEEPDATVVLDDAASSPAIDNLEASATEIGGKPRRAGKKSASATEAAGTGSTPIQPVTGKMKSVEEIQSEADVVEREARRQAIDDGYDPEDAAALGRQARKAHVDTEMAARKSGAATIQPVTGATPTPKTTPDAATPSADAAAPTPDAPKADPIEPVTGRDPVRLADEDQIDAPAPIDAADPVTTPKTSTGDTVVKAQKPGVLRRTMGWLKYPAIIGGIATVGGTIVSNMGNSGGTPPGGGGSGGDGGGTGAGGGDFDPIPVGAGSDGATTMDEDARAAEEARLNRALDRIRGRATANKVPTYQTLQNYNGWR